MESTLEKTEELLSRLTRAEKAQVLQDGSSVQPEPINRGGGG
jgi:hypothetical protein